MITRLIKYAVFGTVTYYAARRAMTEGKLLAIRTEAEREMDALQEELRTMYTSHESFDLSTAEKQRRFDVTIKQYNKWTKIHAETF